MWLVLLWNIGFDNNIKGYSSLLSQYKEATNNRLILHIYIIIRKDYHTYFELIHVFYSWF